MKWWFSIGCLLIGLAMMVAGCTPPGPLSEGEGLPHEVCQELAEIDSLMWKEPDSALTVMLGFAGSAEADSFDEFEGHYCQLLISELLYKNYFGQSNREALLKAVGYFDSIVATNGYKKDGRKADARGASLRERNVFLDARAHYINGTGFYEKGDMVQTCDEYLAALELMEKNFEKEKLLGTRAQFMALIYNRLGDLFSEQYMMECAILCYENAYSFCLIETTSSQGISRTLYNIGKQYDKIGEKEIAEKYYEQAMKEVQDTNSLVYRDIMSTKALYDYSIGYGIEPSLNVFRQVIAQSQSEKEKLTRFLTIGDLFFEEGVYDSAIVYLDLVFENKAEQCSQIQAASLLRVIYDSLENKEKLEECICFLADYKKTEGETKALVSKLEDMFKDYMNQKQKKEAEAERKRSIERTVKIIVPIAIAVALVILVVAKLRGWKMLKQQQAEADKTLEETAKRHEEALKSKELLHEQELKAKQAEALQQMEAAQRIYEEELRKQQAETERLLDEAERKHQQKVEDMVKRHEAELRIQKDRSEKEIEQTRQRHKAELEAERLAYQKEREELQLSLQLSKRSVNTLQEELGRKRTDAKGHYEAFLREPVCVKINDMVRDLHITTRKPYSSYHVNLDDETLAQFGQVVSAYYSEVKPALLCLYPGIAQEDLLLCYLYLLGMENKHVAATRQREYSTVRKQAGELKRRLGIEESVRDYVLHVAGVEEFVKE